MNLLQSELHQMYGQHFNKVSLSLFDSKQWIAQNSVDTLAYGHEDAEPYHPLDKFVEQILSA